MKKKKCILGIHNHVAKKTFAFAQEEVSCMKEKINHVKSKEPYKRRVACCKKVYLRKKDPGLKFWAVVKS